MEIVPGIYQIKLPFPDNQPEHVNAYLIHGNGDWLLVDTGWNTTEAFEALEKQLKEIGVSFTDITKIVATHFHPDHYGLADQVKQLSKAKLALHHVEKKFVASRYVNMDGLLAQVAQWLRLNGVPDASISRLQTASLDRRRFVSPASPDIALYGEEKISCGPFCFEVFWTPGHSPGHICLYEPAKKILLTGDHILPTIVPNVALHPQSGDNPLGDYFDSLRVLEDLEVDLVLPAHEHVFTGLQKRIKEIVQHHEERKAAILRVISKQAKTAYEISLEIPWVIDGVAVPFERLLPFDRRLAVLETLAHLEFLRAELEVERVMRKDVAFYDVAKP